MHDPLTDIRTRPIPQNEPLDETQVKNNAGGFVWALSDVSQHVRRFLVLGSAGGTYYTRERELTKDAAEAVFNMAATSPIQLVDLLVEYSTQGRAPKQNPILFAYAIACSEAAGEHRLYALQQFQKIIRTGTHLFTWCRYMEQFRGWGRAVNRAVAGWYLDKTPHQLAYQVTKYRQREGWTHRDVLRSAHPVLPRTMITDGEFDAYIVDRAQAAIFDWVCGRVTEDLPRIINAYESAQKDGATVATWREAINDGLSWEMLPDAALAEVEVWEQLLDRGKLPLGALLRQLPRLTRLGVARSRRGQITAKLTDGEHLHGARLHPINILLALRAYASGHSMRGDTQWTPDQRIVDALDEAFYASFAHVEPTGKRILLAVDVSGSMTSPISGLPLQSREAAAALAMTTMRVEKDADVVGFLGNWYDMRGGADACQPLPISPRQRLDDIMQIVERSDFGRTDCAAPMLWALRERRHYDAFVLLTDNESWSGAVHPAQALDMYRNWSGIAAKQVIVAMTATNYTVADPKDPLALDVAGFDSAVPQLISSFIS